MDKIPALLCQESEDGTRRLKHNWQNNSTLLHFILLGCCRKSRFEVRCRVRYTMVNGVRTYDTRMPWDPAFTGEVMEVRCHQGHSVSVIIASQQIAGAWLGMYIVYHGTKKRNVESIFRHGMLVGWRSHRQDSYHSVINEHDPDLLPRADVQTLCIGMFTPSIPR